MKKLKVMEEFKIDEISAVDRPAQSHAKMTIMKREEPVEAETEHDEEDDDDDYKEQTEKGEDTMTTKNEPTVADLQKQVAELSQQLEAAKKNDAAKQVEELTAKVTALETEKAALVADAALSDVEKAFIAKMSDDEKKKFRGMSEKERADCMKKAAEADEVVKVDGQEIRKSVVGDAQFAMFQSLAKRLEETEKMAKAEREAREATEFSKRAEEELNHFAGEVVEKAAVLKAIAGIADEKVRGTLNAMLKSGNSALKTAFTTFGHKDGRVNKSADANAFLKKVDEIRIAEKCSHQDAMAKARKNYPEEFKAYNEVQN